MSRSARDLREIINVSRLSVHHDSTSSDGYSSEEIEIPVDATEDSLTNYLNERPSSSLNGSNFSTLCVSTKSVSPSPAKTKEKTNSKRPTTVPLQTYEKIYSSGRHTVPSTEKFPNKYKPVPPIKNKSSNNVNPNETELKNFDFMFHYLDGTIVNTWLQDLNKKLDYINKFMKQKQNFLTFSDFFLSHLTHEKYTQLIDLEYSIIYDQMKYAFHAGLSEKALSKHHINDLLKAVIKEYPKRLKKEMTGVKLLLSIVLVFCTEKDDTYRKLLRNINCTTNNKANIQWLLAIRAFGLISFVVGVLGFYENILKIQGSDIEDGITDDMRMESNEVCLENLAISAVKGDIVNVLDFLCTHTEIDFKKIMDHKKRNLFYVAILEGSLQSAEYLAKIGLSVNEQSENGSFPLSYSVSKNDHETAEFLLKLGVDLNQWNEQCDGATALHTAVMLGDTKMVELLLSYGADLNSKMGVPASITPLAIAQEMNHEEIVFLLKSSLESASS